MIEGLSHITFIVRDLEKMTHFLTIIFDAKEVYSSGDKTCPRSREKFFLINDVWVAVMEGDAPLGKTYNMPGEGSSLYFYDFDNHLFELDTGTLERRLEHYSKNEKTNLWS